MALNYFTGREEMDNVGLSKAQHRMILTLLDGMVNGSIRGDNKDFSTLQSDLRAVREKISMFSTPEELLGDTGKALRSFENYHNLTSEFLRAERRELQNILAMLTETIVHISSMGEGNASRLHKIERQLENPLELTDILKLKERLADCLVHIREEKIRQRTSTEKVASNSNAACDSLTGFGSRPEAETTLATALDHGRNTFAAVLVIDHLHSHNSRFGRRVGDEIILTFAQHLGQNLQPGDLVFRWSGPSFLVVMDRDESADKVRRELAPLVKARLQTTVEFNRRSVMLPVACSWTMFQVHDFDRTTNLVAKIDSYLATQVGPET